MKTDLNPRSRWPLTSAVLISDTPNLQIHMRELIRNTGWRMDDAPAKANEALQYLENGTSFFFIIEDTSAYSAYEALRTLAGHPAGRLTPVLTLLNDPSIVDAPIFERVLHTPTLKKPLTPNTFIPAFKKCVDAWESPIFLTLRKCSYAILNNQAEKAIPTLKKLCEIPEAVPFAVPSLLKIYISQNEWKVAETLMIDSIKKYPRMPSLILTVADFYAQGRMPSEAMRFFKKLKTICNGTPIFSFDIAQTALALGHLDIAIEALTEWSASRPGSEIVAHNLSKLFLAEGHEQNLEKILNMNKGAIKKLSEQWERAELTQSNQPVAS